MIESVKRKMLLFQSDIIVVTLDYKKIVLPTNLNFSEDLPVEQQMKFVYGLHGEKKKLQRENIPSNFYINHEIKFCKTQTSVYKIFIP